MNTMHNSKSILSWYIHNDLKSQKGVVWNQRFFDIFYSIDNLFKNQQGRLDFCFTFAKKIYHYFYPKNRILFWKKIVRPYYKSKTPCMSKNSFVCLQCGSSICSTLRRNHFRKFQKPSNSSVVGKQAFTTSIICSIIVFWCATVSLRNRAWIWIWALDVCI